MTRAQRLETLLELLGRSGHLSLEEAVQALDVSAATIRRDFESLEGRNLLVRTHGGARSHSVSYELPQRYKEVANARAKGVIAQKVVSLIPEGAVVGLSGGTTTSAIAEAIAGRADDDHGLTIVTNAVNIVQLLAIRPSLKVVCCGGVLQSSSYELVGPFCAATLSSVRLDLAFVGANGLDEEFGASTVDEAEAHVNALMARQATEATLVVDASKIGQRAFARIGGQELFARVITDAGLDATGRTGLERAGYQVTVADEEDS